MKRVRETSSRSSNTWEELLREAVKDLEVGCYNKAASASYFAVRMRLEVLIRKRGLVMPRRDDKLANVLRHVGYPNEAAEVLELYELRKRADYSEISLTLEEGFVAVEKAKRLLEKLSEIESSLG